MQFAFIVETKATFTKVPAATATGSLKLGWSMSDPPGKLHESVLTNPYPREIHHPVTAIAPPGKNKVVVANHKFNLALTKRSS
jgi:hypothetical protein